MATEYKENSIGRKILSHLGETLGDLLELTATLVFDLDSFLPSSQYNRRSRDFQKSIGQFKRTGYFKEKQGKLYITEKGRIKIIKNLLTDKRVKKRKQWDGKWRGIIFDIPEINRRERNFLRRELKLIGLIEVQQSIWVFPFDIEKELKILLKLWKTDFQGDIRFILIEKMNDSDLRAQFDLK